MKSTKSKSLCCVPETNSVVGQLYFKNKLIKEIGFVVIGGQAGGGRTG